MSSRQESQAKEKRLKEVIEVVVSTCKAKGWKASKVSQDLENWRYATISVERFIKSGLGYQTVTGFVEISVDGRVKVSFQPTSFYSYGLQDLHNAILAEVGRLPGLEPFKKTPQAKTLQAQPPTPLQQLERLIRRFHIVARQLGHRHNNRETLIIEDEYDVQDLFHALLKVFFDDIRPEEWTPSYAGGSSRMDFLLKTERAVVEVKKTREGLGAKEVGDQLLVDIGRYRAHPDCQTLTCFIYDPEGRIANPDGLESDLSRPIDGMVVKVIVAPKGH